MTPELYQRLKPLYDAALDLPADKRTTFLNQACGGDGELRREIDLLLAANDAGTHKLDAPLVDLRKLYPAQKRTLADGDQLLGRFKIVRLLGWGGMGEVYEAEDNFLRGVHVALKTILPHIAGDPELQERFEREVLLAREVTHSNLCPIYDIFHCEDPPPGYLFLTMKLLPGGTLAARLRQPNPMSTEEGLAVLRQTSLGLAAIHAAGIVHRDIKPNNILIDGSGAELRLWITDFGLARAYQTESTLSAIGTVAGTPGYVAPELFLGAPPSQASDLFALGVVLHEVFTGQKPALTADATSYEPSSRLNSIKLPAFCAQLIVECLQSDPRRRTAAFARALEIIDPNLDRTRYIEPDRKFWTRRRFMGAAAAGVGAIAAGAWWQHDEIEYLFEPLPDQRHVALMAWPTNESAAVVSTVLDSIGQRLARAESFVKNLLIIKGSDLPSDAGFPSNPPESVSSLGANLVLAAALRPTPARTILTLQVLDAATQRVLRTARVWCAPEALSSLADKASSSAAKLLGLPARDAVVKDTDELHRLSPDVFKIYSEAEQLVNQPNDTGLEAAVMKYQQALDMDPHFALGYARLAMAYIDQYLVDGQQAKLSLAQSNATLALRYNPSSAKALLSQAMVYLYSPDPNASLDWFARALKADPGNSETLIYKAQALRRAHQWTQAEQAFLQITQDRPNYWIAHNDLGWMLYRRAKYKEAGVEFDLAANAAPQVAMPKANLAYMKFYQGNRQAAIDDSKDSLRRAPNQDAYLLLGNIAFLDNDYREALKNYIEADAVKPNQDSTLRSIGDCYFVLQDRLQMRKSYERATELLSKWTTANPKSGPGWATLSFYHAKIGDPQEAWADLKNAKINGADDVESQFMISQALTLLGKREDALKLLLSCMDKGLTPVEVDLAPDLRDLQKDPRYLSSISRQRNKTVSGI